MPTFLGEGPGSHLTLRGSHQPCSSLIFKISVWAILMKMGVGEWNLLRVLRDAAFF